jgi:lipoprotein-releasing system ATP-binding protein
VTNQTDIVVDARNLTMRYAVAGRLDVEVFSNLSLTIGRGEIVTLIGPSGSGKSTLLHLLGTLDRPTNGEVIIEGQNMATLDDKQLSFFRNRHIGFIFQFHHLLPEFTAMENVLMPALIAGKQAKEYEERAKLLLESVGLGARMHHRPSALSGGEAQRVAVARAFLLSPSLVLADEPTGNLDTRNSELLFDLIVDLCQKFKQTFLIATHNLDLAKRADRILMMTDGILREEPGHRNRQ